MDEVFSVNSKELCNSAVDVIPKGRVFQLCDYFEQLAVNHEENVPLIAKNSNLNKSHASENLNQDTQTQIFLCNTLGFFPPENTSSCVKRNYTFPVLATPTTALNSIKDRFSSIEPLLTFLFSQHPSSTWKHPIPITGLEKNSGPFVTCYVVSNEATERALKKASRTSVPLKDKLRSWFTFKIIPNYFKKSVPLLNLSSKKVASYLTSKDAQYWYQIQVYLLSSREQNHNATVLKEMAQVYNRLYCRTKELLLCTGILVNVRARHTQKLIEICEVC
ncbi:hypothetical protein HMI56_003959 [Coelomomyces lativittatus]|nr:hypothetical protein HMI56_003959 [Coelomomyces lativittatus]